MRGKSVGGKNSRPNILYINSHDTGRHISPHGHAVETPALQALAGEGILFRNNFCVSPTCSPSRASLLTGCYPHENGMTGLAHRGWKLNDYGCHLARVLGSAGYLTAQAEVQHVARHAGDGQELWQVIGYDRFLERPGEETACRFLESAPREPFYLEVGFYETHRRFPDLDEGSDEAGADPRWCLPPDNLPDTPETRHDMARFKVSVRTLDRKIGLVLEALEKAGLADNTLVVCTTDHGIAFPRRKCTLYDAGLGTMLIMRGPGGFEGGKVIDAQTSHLDIFPTICDLAGVERPGWLRGESLLPLVAGERDKIHDELFFEINYHAAYEPVRAMRTARWKYIRRFDGRRTQVFPNCDGGASAKLWWDNGWKENLMFEEESLFDLLFDPGEQRNLAGSVEHGEVLGKMRRRLEEWMKETADPLLDGPVPAPAGARLDDPDNTSKPESPGFSR